MLYHKLHWEPQGAELLLRAAASLPSPPLQYKMQHITVLNRKVNNTIHWKLRQPQRRTSRYILAVFLQNLYCDTTVVWLTYCSKTCEVYYLLVYLLISY